MYLHFKIHIFQISLIRCRVITTVNNITGVRDKIEKIRRQVFLFRTHGNV